MIELVYAWFWWTTSWGIWSYWYTCSTILFFFYYVVRILGYFFSFSPKRKKKRDSFLYYSSTSSGEEEEELGEEENSRMDEEGNLEKESWGFGEIQDFEEQEEEDNTFSTQFEDDDDTTSRNPISFDRMVSNLTRWMTYAFICTVVILVLIVTGGLFITLLDKWHEERQMQNAYYQAVAECNDKSIRSEQILKACQSARREVGKSVIFGAVKKTFFEMVRSMDACVWYLKSSPAAWLLLAVVFFVIGCKLMWSDRHDPFPRYLKWFHSAKNTRMRGKRRKKQYMYGGNPGNVARGVRKEVAIGMRYRHPKPQIPLSHTRVHHINCTNTFSEAS